MKMYRSTKARGEHKESRYFIREDGVVMVRKPDGREIRSQYQSDADYGANFNRMIRDGQTPQFAAMCAMRQPPGTRGTLPAPRGGRGCDR